MSMHELKTSSNVSFAPDFSFFSMLVQSSLGFFSQLLSSDAILVSKIQKGGALVSWSLHPSPTCAFTRITVLKSFGSLKYAHLKFLL